MLRKLQSFPKIIPSLVEQKYFSWPKTFPIKTDEKPKRAPCMGPKSTLLVCAWPGKVEGGPLAMTKVKPPPVSALSPMFGTSAVLRPRPLGVDSRYLLPRDRASIDTCRPGTVLHRYLHRYLHFKPSSSKWMEPSGCAHP